MCSLLSPFWIAEPGWSWQAQASDTRPEIHAANLAFFAYIANDQVCALTGVIAKLMNAQRLSGEDGAFIAHHVCILLTWWSFLTDDWGHLFALAAMMTEVTALFSNLHYFLLKMHLKSNPLFALNGLALLVSWYWCRIWGYVIFMSMRIWQKIQALSW